MRVNVTEFESLEQQFLEIIGEFRSISTSESRLRDSLRAECTRAEAAEAARDAAERAAAEARNGAAAATAGATQAAAALAKAQDQITTQKIQLELSERHHKLLEERCSDLSTQLSVLEREMQQLRPLQSDHCILQRQYTELQERIGTATEDARREASRLESELRRVERCASSGSEIRERARLAAAAHARERRLAAAELQHTSRELLTTNTEVTRLDALVAELQLRLSRSNESSFKSKIIDPDAEALVELRAALEAERAGAEKLERALAAALADNATLAAKLHSNDNSCSPTKPPLTPPGCSISTNICPIDSFLAD